MYLDTENVPFYIGKGKNGRYKIRAHLRYRNHNPFLTNKINKIGKENVKVHFLHKNLTELEAFYWEKFWIKTIGRRDKKEGTLVNLTDGGEGQSGYKHTIEVKRRIGTAVKGKLAGSKNPMFGTIVPEERRHRISMAMSGENNPMFGLVHSKETKVKMSKAKKGVSLPPFSHEHRQKISAAKKLYWQLKRSKEI